MYAGASGDFNPMHTDEVVGPGVRAAERVRSRDVHRRLLGKALTDYVGVGNLRNYKIRFTKQTWPGEMLTTHVKIAKKYDEGSRAARRPRVLGHEPGRRAEAHRRRRGQPCRRGESDCT